MIKLEALGWDLFFESGLAATGKSGFDIGRVGIESKHQYLLYTKFGELMGESSGRLHYLAESSAELPKVGDWVTISVSEAERKALIHGVLPRKSKFSRKVKGKKTEEQIVATNIDTIFIVQSLDETFSARRIERYLTMAFEGGALPVVILNKADLCEDVEDRVRQVKNIAPDVDTIPMSSIADFGVNTLKELIEEGKTYAFVGPSGAGKSTIINKLIGQDVQKTGDVRAYDSKGRHTTTTRELIVMPQGGLLIDTPGMREVQLWDADAGMREAFTDIEELAAGCRFSDCGHMVETDCAVREALEQGVLTEERYDSYVKLQKEVAQLAARQTLSGTIERKKRDKQVYKALKKFYKER